MAENNRTKTPAFHEVVFHGSPKAVRGLLAGVILGADEAADVWFHDDFEIENPDVPRTVRRTVERLHLMPVSEVRAVVTADLARRLRSLKKRIKATGICELASVKRIKNARVALEYHSYAKRYDDEVQALLGDLPRGVKLVDVERELKLDPEAEGVEAYAPVHHYEASGSAALVGRFDLVLDLRDRLDVHPLIQCEELELELA